MNYVQGEDNGHTTNHYCYQKMRETNKKMHSVFFHAMGNTLTYNLQNNNKATQLQIK